ncbi:vascular endothelial growth factor receptor 1-like [Oratosquilla oratoria]|uniref:vascular endothelial growth factor receptor 1-like n=1 Tax=Oratosquilla oratoria TaxID=337810 RepID=UPI003F76FEFC
MAAPGDAKILLSLLGTITMLLLDVGSALELRDPPTTEFYSLSKKSLSSSLGGNRNNDIRYMLWNNSSEQLSSLDGSQDGNSEKRERRVQNGTWGRPRRRERQADITPPRLDVGEEVVVNVTAGETIILRCEGEAPLLWNYTSTELYEGDKRINITDHMRKDTNANYVSTLQVSPAEAYDTGFFYCMYEDRTSNFDSTKADFTYVYAYDVETPLLEPIEMFMTITTADKLVIDCRPSHPSIQLTLSKNDIQVDEPGVWYDPKIGFTRKSLAVTHSGMYTCIADIPSTFPVCSDCETTRYVRVIISASQNKLPSPAISTSPITHFVVGLPFMLTCSVISGENVIFHWTWPNKAIKPTIMQQRNDQKSSDLTIHEPVLEDSGIYTCKVTANGMLSNENTYLVTVKEEQESYINVSSQVRRIVCEEGDVIQWKTVIKSFPYNPEVIFFFRNEEILPEVDDRVRTFVNTTEGEAWLEIFGVIAMDFGQYTIKGITADGAAKDSVSLNLIVKSSPVTQMHEIPPIPIGETRIIQCQVEGYPLPEVKWSFEKCQQDDGHCDSSFTYMEETHRTQEGYQIDKLENWFMEEKLVRGTDSGFLHCRAKNEIGMDYSTIPIRVTDIGDSFIFIMSSDDDHQIPLINHEEVLQVIEGDQIQIQCGGIKFDYKNVTLSIPIVSDFKIYNNITSISWKYTTARQSVRIEDAGKYICEGERHMKNGVLGNLTSRELTLQVREQAPPMFLPDANVMPHGISESVEEKTKDFQLNCTVTGVPTPTVSWFKDGVEFMPPEDSNIQISGDKQHIIFPFVFKENEGRYECQVANRLLQIRGSFTLAVTQRREGMSVGMRVGLGFAMVGILVLIAAVVMLWRRVQKERKHRKSFRKIELYMFEQGRLGEINRDCTADEQAELLPYDKAWEIPRNRITIGTQLGSGAFGRVVKGKVAGLQEGRESTTVAIKMCKSTSDPAQLRALTLELKIMIHLGKHLNIVNLMGASTINVGKGELWILVEFCRYGDLLKYIQKHRNHFVNQLDPNTGLIDPSITIASPLSPPTSARPGYRSLPQTDPDGYLSPSSPAFPVFKFGSLPKGFNSSAPSSEVTTSPTHNCNASGRQYVGNPGYASTLQAPGVNSYGYSVPPDNGNRSVSPAGPTLPVRTSSIGSGSVPSLPTGYRQVVNTDMTVVSMAPTRPMSPTGSTVPSECPVDSQGNPFVYEYGDVPGENVPITTSDLVCWGWQVSKGMEYLKQRKVLHGDLALRNLLFAYPNVVKISDFGLARDIYKREFYQKQGDDLMPIKWMSIEAIRDRIFTTQSDVWAFGVVLWELFTLGNTPYPGVEVNPNFLKMLEGGFRMEKPKYANDYLYSLMMDCWKEDPMLRTNFEDLSEQLATLLRPELQSHYMQMNAPFLKMNEDRFRDGKDILATLASPDFENQQFVDPPHYVNLQHAEDLNCQSEYLSMKSPSTVGYSCVGSIPVQGSKDEGDMKGGSGGSQMQARGENQVGYLPMGSAEMTTPVANIFSPRPNVEPSKFTFDDQSTVLQPSSPTKWPSTNPFRSETPVQESEEKAKIENNEEKDHGDNCNENMSDEKTEFINEDTSDGNKLNDEVDGKLCFIKENDENNYEKEKSLKDEVSYINLPSHQGLYVNLP